MREEKNKWRGMFFFSIIFIVSFIVSITVSTKIVNQKQEQKDEKVYLMNFKSGLDVQRKVDEVILQFSYEQDGDTIAELINLSNSLRDVKSISEANDKIQEVNEFIKEKTNELERNNNMENTEKGTILLKSN